ncbi:hypothetical protein [Flavobacterium phage FPSV-S1]|nr:hypothetical protein [Flavobacterium phage FPSV-S1]QCW20489.1 hypothetical protein [Flavobacterium phage FPSV-S8]QCW20652.1 hypothetical protein [Flavobacterium phage FPSV-S27]
MLRPVNNIQIGDNNFDFVTEGKFTSTWKTFTDTGEITLPYKFSKDKKVICAGKENLFKKGDVVQVDSGYFPNKQTIFKGYVSAIIPKNPVVLKVEDAAWLLKQTNLTLSFPHVTLKTLLTQCIDAAKAKATGFVKEGLKRIKVEAVNADLGTFRLTNVNIVNVLDELKKTYALRSYFRGDTLFVGLAYDYTGKRGKLVFQEDIFDDDLEYLKKDDVKFKVKAISMLENNKKIEIEVGDPSGEQRTITKYNLTKEELKKVAEREIDTLRYEGFRGKFKTFLQPVFYHGDEVELIDKDLPERNGVYLIEGIEYEIGVGGAFQIITLGAKISA